METTFYEDSRYRGEPRPTKRPATLDLDAVRSKKPRCASALLTSPDLHMLKLESPELEKLIIQQHGLAGQQCMYTDKAADDREQQHYPRDFPDVLGSSLPTSSSMHLYHHPTSDMGALPPPTSMVDTYYHQQQPLSSININCNPMVSSAMSCYAPGNGYYGTDSLLAIKEEPQTVPSCAGGPSSPPRSPIDMEDQERMKLERKRLRNRIAASKCRRRKLERIARLEDKVAHLKNENAELSGHVTRLRDHVCQLKQQVMEHVRSGCEILVSSYPAAYEPL